MLRNERGMILPVTMMVLLLLTTLAVAVAGLGTSEPQIARNLADAAQARALAEAGLEIGYLQLATSMNWTTLIASPNTNGEVVLATNLALPGIATSVGTYSLILRNDYRNGDNLITGVAKEAANNVDTNNRLILVATGTMGTATRTIQAMVKRTATPTQTGAIAFPGNEANTMFTGDAFLVTGNDTNLNGSAGSCSSVYGISVAGTTSETQVQTSLSSAQKDNITGKKQVSSGTAQGDNTIAPDTSVASAAITQFAHDVKLNADIVYNSPSPNGLSFTNIGGTSNCSNPSSTSCWGTAANPKIVYIKGTPDPSSNFTAVALNAGGTVEGHGILIVEDGDLVVKGNFLWHGLVIVTGQWVGLGFMGNTSTTDQNVYGGVIINETAVDPAFEGVVAADAKLRYSCEGLNQGRSSRKLVTMSSWQEIGN
jgi:Tfp pilus assembly protein PilX